MSYEAFMDLVRAVAAVLLVGIGLAGLKGIFRGLFPGGD